MLNSNFSEFNFGKEIIGKRNESFKTIEHPFRKPITRSRKAIGNGNQ